MRRTESQIKSAILHSEEEIRWTALQYFTSSHTTDTSLMPLVIEAVEELGREQAIGLLRLADDLPQTESTIQWLTEELAKEWDFRQVAHDNHCFVVGLILNNARTDLLRPEISELKCFPDELRAGFLERLQMAAWDWGTGWDTLEQLARQAAEQGGLSPEESQRAQRVIESLTRHTEKSELVLGLLRDYDDPSWEWLDWVECYLVELAGRMKLEAAIPSLLVRLHDDDDVETSEAALDALIWIGGDAVVRAIHGEWLAGEAGFRILAAEVLYRIHTDLSLQTCLNFLPAEEDHDVLDALHQALLAQFADEAVEPVRAAVLGDAEDLWDEALELRQDLVATCTVMGVTFPEYDAWYQDAVDDDWGWEDWNDRRIRESYLQEDEEDDWDGEYAYDDDQFEDDGFEEEDGDDDDEDDDDEDFPDDDFDEEPDGPKPIRYEQPRVGRNDPCPCGSGNKYKKCCLRKEQPGEPD